MTNRQRQAVRPANQLTDEHEGAINSCHSFSRPPGVRERAVPTARPTRQRSGGGTRTENRSATPVDSTLNYTM